MRVRNYHEKQPREAGIKLACNGISRKGAVISSHERKLNNFWVETTATGSLLHFDLRMSISRFSRLQVLLSQVKLELKILSLNGLSWVKLGWQSLALIFTETFHL